MQMADKVEFIGDENTKTTLHHSGRRQTRSVTRKTAAEGSSRHQLLRSYKKQPLKQKLDYQDESDIKGHIKASSRKQSLSSQKAKGKTRVTRQQVLGEEESDNSNNYSHGCDGGIQNGDKNYEMDSSDQEDELDENNNDDDYSSEEELIVPTALANDAVISGQEVFGFQTPRRTGSLAQAASEAIHVKKAKTANSIQKSKGKTPKSVSRGKTPNRKIYQGQQQMKDKDVHEQAKKTRSVASVSISPGKSSSRARRPAALVRNSFIDESGEESSDNSSGSEGREAAGLGKKGSIQPDDQTGMVEEYFAVHGSSKFLTSDRTLASLGTPCMDQQKLSSHLQQVSSTHPTECIQLYKDYRRSFSKWMFQMRHGFSLLLYGLGSKRVLIDQFRSSMLQGCTQLVVNGFFPSITIKHVLNTITEEVLGHDGTFRNVIDQTSFIQEMFKKGKGPGNLYLIVHNIDGAMLRSKKAQTVLSLLAEVPFIHVIASIDHINAPLVWDQTMCGRFKWLWNDVTTFDPYMEETSYENSLLVQQSGALALSSMTHVMRSLTPNGRGIFLLIVKHQLQEKDNSSYIGFAIYDLYTKCREGFLVNSEQTLRAQLTEFRDHKLIRSRKGTDGVECLYIPLDASTLKQFLEDQESNSR